MSIENRYAKATVRRFFNLQAPAIHPVAPSAFVPSRSRKTALRLPASTRMLNVQGESHYMPALRKLVSTQGVNLGRVDEFDTGDLWLRLTPEPTNQYDRNAIMVTSPKGSCLGYLGREQAAKYVEVITELAVKHDLWCKAQVGGGRYPSGWRIGVWLFIPTPTELTQLAGNKTAGSMALLEGKWRDATTIPTGRICSSPALG
jgi:hypothetical protein